MRPPSANADFVNGLLTQVEEIGVDMDTLDGVKRLFFENSHFFLTLSLIYILGVQGAKERIDRRPTNWQSHEIAQTALLSGLRSGINVISLMLAGILLMLGNIADKIH